MSDWWPAVLLGWPAIIVAVGLAAAGIYRNKPLWLVAAAILAAPVSFYIAGSPRYGWLAALMSPMLIVASVLVRYRRAHVAWYCFAPFVGVVGWLAVLVASE